MGKTAGLRLCVSFLIGVLGVLLVPAFASAHVERASYWPDPAPDCSISPCAGGAVPTARPLASAVTTDRSVTHVVCQQNSLRLLKQSVTRAVSTGYVLRPSQGTQTITASQGHALVDLNRKLYQRCRYHSIQQAVTESGNNNRVVIMPGLYTEPASRAAATHDPACTQYQITNDRGDVTALSYKYQFYCPNDQNLIAVLGREPGGTNPPDPPAFDRHGIPDLGPCIRCNLQIEGSGVGPDDVVIDAGRVQSGDGSPIGSVKDVGIRGDRADGLVIRNLKVRHAQEHDIYVLESDGYLLDRFKVFYPGEYGVLTFVEDHGLMQNCEAVGADDSGLYPGAGADTGAQRDTAPQSWKDYTDPNVSYANFRLSQEIRNCDMHHNASGYSGTDGNATHLDHNEIYDNVLGFTTDVFTAAGHPGFPQDSDLIEFNNFYSNNLDLYAPGSDITPSEPFPIGVGLWIAGGNDNIIRYNYFYDNWRRGTMAFAVPDQVVCGQGIGVDPSQLAGCNPQAVPPSTSYRNQFYGNVMGRSPGGQVLPNGNDPSQGFVDFWWDEYSGNTGNCWHDNVGKNGMAGSVTSLPVSAPAGTPNAPHFLPQICDDTSVGAGGGPQEAELGNCLVNFTVEPPAGTCPWFTKPPKP
jgi:hypothetical protein